MAYYLSYIFNRDAMGKWTSTGPAGTYHASLALTEHNPPEAPRVIAKVGFFSNSQVRVEDDFTSPYLKRYHRSYPITGAQAKLFLSTAGADQLEWSHAAHSRVAAPLPKRLRYDFYRFNCKSYVLSVMKRLGIVDENLNNWLIDSIMPNPSGGTLHRAEFALDPNSSDKNPIFVWKTPPILSKTVGETRWWKHLVGQEVLDMKFVEKFN